ncbi:hypothetical protein BC829DRAFT_301428 [Chytridium lagenaria]|nr:hypothetical protein BC829DRAFT_301428 [Chytridium lagenaria]
MSPSRSSSPAQPQSNTDTTNPDLTTQLPDTSSNRSSIFRRRRASFAGSFLFSDHDGKKRGHLVSAASTDSLKDDVLLRTKKDTNLPHEATTPLPPQQLHECRMMFGVKSKQTISDKLPFKPLSKRNSRALFLSIPAPTEEPEERTTSSNIFCRRKTICGPKTAPTENTPSLPDPSTYIDESTGFLVPPSAAPPTSLPPPIHKNLRRKSFFKLPSFSRSPHPTASELPESKVWSAGAAWSEAEALRQSDVDAPSPPPPDLIDRPPSTKSYEAENVEPAHPPGPPPLPGPPPHPLTRSSTAGAVTVTPCCHGDFEAGTTADAETAFTGL